MTTKHPDYIDGKRIRLHPAVLGDRWRIFQGLARSDVTDILLRHPSQTSTPLLSYDDFSDDYKQHFFDDSNPEGGRCFMIEANGQAVGQVNYNDIERARSRAELDIWMFSKEYCGQGYGSEALGLLCDYLESRLGVEGFYIKPSASNRRAIRCYEKAGFRRSALSDEEALREYGPKDSVDTVYMARNIEQQHAG